MDYLTVTYAVIMIPSVSFIIVIIVKYFVTKGSEQRETGQVFCVYAKVLINTFATDQEYWF